MAIVSAGLLAVSATRVIFTSAALVGLALSLLGAIVRPMGGHEVGSGVADWVTGKPGL